MLFRFFIFLLSMSLLNACTLQPVKFFPMKTHVLQEVGNIKVRSRTPHTILVSKTQAATAYRSTQMLYMQSPYQLQAFTENRWFAPPGQMLLPLVLESLRRTRHFHAVVASPFVGEVDFRLDTYLKELVQHFDTRKSKIVLKVQANLINNRSNQVISSRTFSISMPADSANPKAGVVAANRAVKQMLEQLTRFVVRDTEKLYPDFPPRGKAGSVSIRTTR